MILVTCLSFGSSSAQDLDMRESALKESQEITHFIISAPKSMQKGKSYTMFLRGLESRADTIELFLYFRKQLVIRMGKKFVNGNSEFQWQVPTEITATKPYHFEGKTYTGIKGKSEDFEIKMSKKAAVTTGIIGGVIVGGTLIAILVKLITSIETGGGAGTPSTVPIYQGI